jgi:WD40 repeat protein
MQTLKGYREPVSSIAFSSDGKAMASGTHDGVIQFWDAITGTALQMLKGHRRSINYLAFSPDSEIMASASEDRTLRLWNFTTGAVLHTLKGHAGAIHTAVFSPDGKMVASASKDKTVRLWDTATGAALRKFDNCFVSELSFSRDALCLETDRGRLRIQPGSADELAHNLRPYTVFLKEDWITQDERNHLWLPADYRPSCSAYQGNLLVLGHPSGEVTFIQFKSPN